MPSEIFYSRSNDLLIGNDEQSIVIGKRLCFNILEEQELHRYHRTGEVTLGILFVFEKFCPYIAQIFPQLSQASVDNLQGTIVPFTGDFEDSCDVKNGEVIGSGMTRVCVFQDKYLEVPDVVLNGRFDIDMSMHLLFVAQLPIHMLQGMEIEEMAEHPQVQVRSVSVSPNQIDVVY